MQSKPCIRLDWKSTFCTMVLSLRTCLELISKRFVSTKFTSPSLLGKREQPISFNVTISASYSEIAGSILAILSNSSGWRRIDGGRRVAEQRNGAAVSRKHWE